MVDRIVTKNWQSPSESVIKHLLFIKSFPLHLTFEQILIIIIEAPGMFIHI